MDEAAGAGIPIDERSGEAPLSRAIEEIAECERRYRMLVGMNLVGIASGDVERITEANDAFLAIVGCSREDLRDGGIRWRELTAPDNHYLDERSLGELLTREVGSPYESELVRRDGNRVRVRIGRSRLARKPLRWICTVLVVGEQKRARSQRAELDRERAAHAEVEEAANQLRAIQQVTDTALAHLDLESLVRELLGRVRTSLAADTSSILLLTEDGHDLVAWASRGLEEEVEQHVRVPVGRGITGRIVASREPLIVEDISKVEVSSAALRGRVRSVIGAPLIAEDRVLGAILVGSAERRRFGDSDLALLRLVADRAALAIESAKLYTRSLDSARRNEESLALIDTFQASAPVGFGFWDRDLRYVRINEALAAINGLPIAKHIGRKVREVLPQLAEALEPTLQSVLETGRPAIDLEVAGETPALPGVQRHWLANYYPVRLPAGEIIGVGGVVTEVTERKRAEEQLSRLAAIVESSDDVIIGKTLDGTITSWNPSAERAYGYTAAEAIGRPISLIIPSDRPDELPSILARIRRGERIDHFETVRVRKDGERLNVSVSISPIHDAPGRVIGAATIARDITERKRDEAERERLHDEVELQRRLLEAVIENAPAAIAVLRGPNLVFELINPAYQALAPGKEMKGKPFAEVWPELVELVVPILIRVASSGKPHRSVDALRPVRRVAQGPIEEAYFTFSNLPIHFEDDQQSAILLVGVETTEQVRARRQIEHLAELAQRRAAELQGILNNMIDAVLVSDIAGNIVLTNEAGVQLLGFTCPDDVTCALDRLSIILAIRHLDGRPVTYENQPLVRALTGQTIVGEDEIFLNQRTGLDVFIRTSAAPIRDERGVISGAVEVARDVTELTALDRLKDEFLAVAAHELKTPVTIMKGYAEAMQRLSGDLSQPRRRMLEAIDRGADRIDRIVDDLLDVSQLHVGQLELRNERVDLPELVGAVANRLALDAGRHRVQVVRAEPVIVRGDRGRIEHVVSSLVDNAIRYSPEGGDVDLSVSVEDSKAVVSVVDRGIGIPKSKQAHIFERFYRAHTGTPFDYGGMGVGLYIAREIVARHGGRVWFESEEGKGSTFHFSLPLGVPDPKPVI